MMIDPIAIPGPAAGPQRSTPPDLAVVPDVSVGFDAAPPLPDEPPQGLPKAALAFEAVVLRTFVEAMLPREGFGAGTAGHMWRGQMAEALADTLARSGGVGIAAALRDDLR